MMELSGTNWVVEKPLAVKFYVPPQLMEHCEAVFEEQGVKLSEGLTRLIRLLVESPPELRSVLLGQAQGDAPTAIAEYIVNNPRKRKKYRSIFPTEPASHPQPGDPPHEQRDKTPRAPSSRSAK